MSRDAEIAAAWQKAAEQGDADAQYALGEAYRLGLKVDRDPRRAVLWLTKAQAQGHPQAAYALGQLKAQGFDVSPPPETPKKKRGQPSLDELLDSLKPADGPEGDGGMDAPVHLPEPESDPLDLDGDFDVNEALAAAKNGDFAAMVALGNAYRLGQGVEEDEVEAFSWYERAAKAGDLRGLFSLGVMFEHGMGVRASDSQALRCYLAAAEAGDAEAQFNAANMIRAGRGRPADAGAAAQLYAKAAAQGDSAALFALGGLAEENGDLADALAFYRKAAAAGSGEAQFNLGNMARLGRGMEMDGDAAMEFYAQASQQGLLKAQVNLGLMLLDSDDVSAAYWLRRAAAAGDQLAQLNYGGLSAAGKGCAKDEIEAHMWLDAAAAGPDAAIAAAARKGADSLARIIGPSGLQESRLRRSRRLPGA